MTVRRLIERLMEMAELDDEVRIADKEDDLYRFTMQRTDDYGAMAIIIHPIDSLPGNLPKK